MLLKSLRVYKNDKVIRSIDFKSGLNLILDTTTEKKTESGNSIGKTTTLRIVDYCLGSEGKDIYIDPEFKTPNQQIEELIEKNEIIVALTLNNGKRDIILRRDLSKTPNFFEINGEEVSNEKEYRNRLSKVIFGFALEKPPFRSVIRKFIRSDHHSMSHTLKFLHPATTDPEYEALHLFLFAFLDHNLIKNKSELSKKIDKAKKTLTTYTANTSPNSLRQMLTVINGDINEQKKKAADFKVAEVYSEELENLKPLREVISSVSLEISELEIKLQTNSLTLEQLKEDVSKIDSKTVERIYQEAKHHIPNLQKTLEDAISFHNTMVTKKLTFIERGMESLEEQIAEKREELNKVAQQESNILRLLSSKGSLDDLQVLQRKLNGLYEQKGQKESALHAIEEIQTQVSKLEDQMKKLDEKFTDYLGDLNNKVTTFNKFFSNISEQLYEEKFVLSYDKGKAKSKGVYKFKIDNIAGNEGGGKKKAQVGAFDLAYIQFAMELDLKTLYFVMHDSIEDVHDNQIRTLFNIANGLDGQFVVSMLRDKLSTIDEEEIKKNTVLELNQDNKFFNI